NFIIEIYWWYRGRNLGLARDVRHRSRIDDFGLVGGLQNVAGTSTQFQRNLWKVDAIGFASCQNTTGFTTGFFSWRNGVWFNVRTIHHLGFPYGKTAVQCRLFDCGKFRISWCSWRFGGSESREIAKLFKFKPNYYVFVNRSFGKLGVYLFRWRNLLGIDFGR